VLTVGSLLDELGLQLSAGEAEAERPIRWVHISELEDPTPWLNGGELLLTTGFRLKTAAAQRQFVRLLAEHGLAGLGFGIGFEHQRLPKALVAEAEKLEFPLFEIPYEMPFIALTEKAFTRLVNEQYSVLERGTALHERLERLVIEQRGLGEILGSVAAAIGGAAIVLDGGGRVIARSRGGEPVKRGVMSALSEQVAARATERRAGPFIPEHNGSGDRCLALPVPARGEGVPRAWLTVVRESEPIGDFERAHDIGTEYDPVTPGSTTFNGTTYSVSGGGSDVWDGGDHMHFVYKKVTGDFVATTRIANVINPPNTRWGRAGIMARYSVHDSAKYSLACVPYRGEDPPNSDTKRHQSRRDFHESFGVNTVRDGTGNTSREQQVVPAGAVSQAPTGWIRLVRKGNAFFSLFANDVDGAPGPWALAGSDHHPDPPDTLLLGLIASPHGSAGANLLTVDYDHWSVQPLSLAPNDCKVLSTLVTTDFGGTLAELGAVVVNGSGAAFNADIVGGKLRLTQDGVGNSANAVWFNTNGALLGNSGFIASFDAYYSKPAGADPADGITFAVVEGDFALATGLVGDAGGGIAYNRGDHNAIPAARLKSFAVEFDNWDGGHGSNDPRGQGSGGSNQDDRYHVGIDVNFDEQSSVNNVEWGAEVPPYYNRPAGIHVEAEYNPADSTGSGVASLRVFVTANDGSFPRTQVVGAVVPKMTDIFLGFTGATGGATCTQEVDNFSLTRLCCENVDSVEITGPTETVHGINVDLTATGGGTEASGSPDYSWSIVSGPGAIIGPSDQATVEVACTGIGVVQVQVTLGDGVCMDMASDVHEVTCVCPVDGDTHCTGLALESGPAGNIQGSYTFRASALDDSGQPVTYSFAEGDVTMQVGPGDTFSVDLAEGQHTIRVTVDDDADCPDEAEDNTCALEVTVVEGGGRQIPGDCNQDAVLNLSDPVCLLNYLFSNEGPAAEGLPCQTDAGDMLLMDANGDELVDLSDALSGLNYLFGTCSFGPPCPAHVLGAECTRIVGCPDLCE
jgi:hypothetical protein